MINVDWLRVALWVVLTLVIAQQALQLLGATRIVMDCYHLVFIGRKRSGEDKRKCPSNEPFFHHVKKEKLHRDNSVLSQDRNFPSYFQ